MGQESSVGGETPFARLLVSAAPLARRRHGRRAVARVPLRGDQRAAGFHPGQEIVEQLVALGGLGVGEVVPLPDVSGEMIRQLQGMDGLLIYYILFNHQLDYVELRELVEYLIDHDIIQRQLDRKGEDAKREWMRMKLRELREAGQQVTWDQAMNSTLVLAPTSYAFDATPPACEVPRPGITKFV